MFHYRCCLAYVIADQLGNELKEFLNYWNSHVIRSNRATGFLSAIPNDLYTMPNDYGEST